MKKSLKTIAALLLALLMTLSLAACALTDDAAEGDAAADTAAEDSEQAALSAEERALVAAKVGDYEITKGEVYDQYQYMAYMYSYYGQTLTAEADIESLQDQVLSSLIADKTVLNQAKLMGLEALSEEETAAVDEEYQGYIEEILTEYRSYAEEEGAEDVEARAVELINEDLASGEAYEDWEAYKAYVLQSVSEEKTRSKVEQAIKDTVTISDEAVQAYYDDLVAQQQEAYAAQPATYLTEEENYEMQGGDPILVTPEGYVRVKVISIEPQGEKSEELTHAETALASLEAEYGKLALSGDAADKARMTEIQTEYAEALSNYNTLYEAFAGESRASMDAAYTKLSQGTDFDVVLKEFGDDSSYETYEQIGQKGRLMLLDGEDGWAQELHDAVKELNEGEYSGVIVSGDAFYIVQLVSFVPSSVVAFDEVKDLVHDAALAEQQETLWSEKQDEWLNDESVVTRYEDVYRDIGK